MTVTTGDAGGHGHGVVDGSGDVPGAGTGAGGGGRGRGRRRPWALGVLAVATAAMVVYLLSAYVPPAMATSRIPPRDTTHYVLLVAHIFTAAVAALTGPAQFWPWLRRRCPVVHRWTGRAYFFLGVFPSSLLAVPVTVYAPFGSANQAALGLLDVLWAATAVAGYRAVRQGRYADHRRWMVRNFALTLGALASRVWIPIMVLIALPQTKDATVMTHDIASGSAWLGLTVNLLLAELHLNRRRRAPRRGSAAGGRRARRGVVPAEPVGRGSVSPGRRGPVPPESVEQGPCQPERREPGQPESGRRGSAPPERRGCGADGAATA